MIYIDDQDAAMHFENLARKVFDCNRAGDPWGYAEAGNAYLLYEPEEEGKQMMHTIIDVAIWNNKNNEQFVKALLVIKDKVTNTNKAGELAGKVMYELIELLNKNGY